MRTKGAKNKRSSSGPKTERFELRCSKHLLENIEKMQEYRPLFYKNKSEVVVAILEDYFSKEYNWMSLRDLLLLPSK